MRRPSGGLTILATVPGSRATNTFLQRVGSVFGSLAPIANGIEVENAEGPDGGVHDGGGEHNRSSTEKELNHSVRRVGRMEEPAEGYAELA